MIGSQQTWIAATLLIGFVVFVTVRNELPLYLQVFQSSTALPTTPPQGALYGVNAALCSIGKILGGKLPTGCT